MPGARSEPFREVACPLGVCDGSGWILGPEDVARECECRAQRLQRSRMRGVASVIPPRYRGVSFDRPPVSDMDRDLSRRAVVQVVKSYCDELEQNIAAGQGLWLMGNTGTGKTTLAMLIAKEALAAGKTVAVYFTPKLFTQIRQTYEAADSEDRYKAFFERLTSVDLLYIDDLGSERRTDWVVEQLYALVNERYERNSPMLVTSNAIFERTADVAVEKAQERLTEQVGIRTISRLTEICGEPIPLFGQDHRTMPSLAELPGERSGT